MYVRAISIGHAVPRTDFDAVVHSVFDSVVNLKPKGADRLLTVLASGDIDLPQGIRLEGATGLSFTPLTSRIQVTCRGGMLLFGGYPLTIDLQQAACWDSNLPAWQADLSNPRVLSAWQHAWQALNNQQALHAPGLIARELLGGSASQPVWIGQAGRCMRSIVEATRRSGTIPCEALRQLIGLGPGLTPSGDDLIAGYMIGLRCAARGESGRLRFLSSLGSAVIDLSARTCDISRTYLFYAARGRASSRLLDLAEAICSGAPQGDTIRIAVAAMRVGETSGTDAVTGLLMGLAVWDAPQLAGIY